MTRCALVTGGGTGIGRSAALALAADGYAVVLAGRRAEPIEAVAAEVAAAGGRALAVAGDLAVPDDAARAVAVGGRRVRRAARRRQQRGLDPPQRPPARGRRSSAGTSRSRSTCAGPTSSCNAALPELLRAEGDRSIVNVASTLAVKLVPGIAPYAAAKGALISLTKAVAVEYGGDGIRCNAVLPAVVDTPLARADRPDFEARQDAMAEAYPLGRLGEPDEVGEAIRWLCSPGAGWISGATLNVDGGFTAT